MLAKQAELNSEKLLKEQLKEESRLKKREQIR